MYWNIAAIVGVPGVGKTSLCKSAAMALGYKHVNYGELMLEVAISNDMALTQNEMFKLEIEDQHFIWESAAFKLREICEDYNNILVDLHGIDISNIGYIISLPFEIISPDLIIVVESSYENIKMRRISDLLRNRVIEDKKTIHRHMKILRMSMMICSVMCNSYLSILDNDDYEVSLAELKDILCGVGSN
jgi:adenylate kinase